MDYLLIFARAILVILAAVLGIFGISLPYSKGIIFREENSVQYECQTVTMQYLGVSNYGNPVWY